MKTGNKNQATILAIVAVGAIAFLVIQMLPAKTKAGLGLAVPVAAQASPVASIGELPLALVGDPFSHPRLATKPVGRQRGQQVPSEVRGIGIVDPLKGLPADWGAGGSTGDQNPGTEGNAGDDREKPQGPQITVLAVMQAATPVAMLEVAGKEGKTFKIGELLADNARLIAIGGSYVKVRINGEVHRITTGGTYSAGGGDKK